VLAGLPGLLLLAAAAVVALGFGAFVSSLLGGLTGDVFGAVVVLVEVVTLLVFLALVGEGVLT
jgi:cobalamin synthase